MDSQGERKEGSARETPLTADRYTWSVVEDGGASEAAMRQVRERTGCVSHVVGDRGRTDAEPLGKLQKLLAVPPGIGSDTAQSALPEQLGVVVERGNVRQPDSCHSKRCAGIECAQRDRNQLAGRREQNRAVKAFR